MLQIPFGIPVFYWWKCSYYTCCDCNNLLFTSSCKPCFVFLFRWANQGLDFLTVACDPKTLKTLSETEFQVKVLFSNTKNNALCKLLQSHKLTKTFLGKEDSFFFYLGVTVNRMVTQSSERKKVVRKLLIIFSSISLQGLKKEINACICHAIGSAESCSGANSPGKK